MSNKISDTIKNGEAEFEKKFYDGVSKNPVEIKYFIRSQQLALLRAVRESTPAGCQCILDLIKEAESEAEK